MIRILHRLLLQGGIYLNIESLFHRPEHFTAPAESLSPAEKASRKWDEREGEIIEQNYNLRRLLIGLVIAIAALAGALCYKSVTENTLVYVVETDIKTGEVRNVGTANSMANYTPSDEVYNYFIRQFVQDIRSIPLDEVVYTQQLKTAYGYLTKDGANIFNARMEAEKRVEKLHKSTVQVTINSVISMEGGKSYQVRWTEVEYRAGGKREGTPYTGLFTVEIIKTDDKEKLAVNPLGLYIKDLRWERDAETKTAPQDTKESESKPAEAKPATPAL